MKYNNNVSATREQPIYMQSRHKLITHGSVSKPASIHLCKHTYVLTCVHTFASTVHAV